jgi:fructose-bisphosphate aldolase class II
MIDGSSLSYEENVALTKKVVEYAHDINAHPSNPRYITVEGELGVLAGVEEDVVAENHSYTDPNLVEDFVKRTGVDSLAIAIGTSHGAYKFKPGTKPMLRFDILEEVSKRLPGFPIVLHGASSVMQDYVAMVNQYGGSMPDAIGVPEELLQKASKMAVCKINIDSDVRLACTAMVRKHLYEHPDHFDPRQYMGDARQAIHDIVSHKIKAVLGSENKA